MRHNQARLQQKFLLPSRFFSRRVLSWAASTPRVRHSYRIHYMVSHMRSPDLCWVKSSPASSRNSKLTGARKCGAVRIPIQTFADSVHGDRLRHRFTEYAVIRSVPMQATVESPSRQGFWSAMAQGQQSWPHLSGRHGAAPLYLSPEQNLPSLVSRA